MFFRNFHPDSFFRGVLGTQPFAEYCGLRGILFETFGGPLHEDDFRRWALAAGEFPDEQQVRVEMELSRVNEMADREPLAHLFRAAEGGELPADTVPGDAAVALWFFLHHADLFHEVLLGLEAGERDCWECARATPGLEINFLEAKAHALSATLQDFFRSREGSGRFCAVDCRRLSESYCFVAHVSDRLHLADVFTSAGERGVQQFWPAVPVIFVYYPRDGTVALKAPVRAAEWTFELFQRFGRAVLGLELDAGAVGHAFDLDLLRRRFDPLPDGEDMEVVRVKTLHLVYPERCGRRQVKLETLTGDEQFAVLQMLQAHLAADGIFDQLRVAYAELQFRLRADGLARTHLVRLWPDRSNLGQGPLADRFRDCLRRWGVYHGR